MKSIAEFLYARWGYIAFLVLLAIMVLHVSGLLLWILAALVLGICLLEAMKLKLWLGFQEHSDVVLNCDRPMVSVHLAIYNEPPAMVIATIDSILEQDYPEFELIIIDNNTKDETLWMPIAEYCERLPKVRFFHLKNWPFFKSGALNFARKVTHSKAEFIFVVDADYCLNPKALTTAVCNSEGANNALVQFPQAYVCEQDNHTPIISEFDHFFSYYCFKANTCRGALATGTLSLIRVAALDRVGGWPVNSITEDAELGARLQVAGFDIRYVHRIIGKGIAPIRQEDFIKQRKRWIFGNVQTLFAYTMSPWRNFEKWLSGVSQLTAWANMLGFPILVLTACFFVSPWLDAASFAGLSVLAYMAFWIFTLSKLLQFHLVNERGEAAAFRTFLINFSSLDIGAFHWWPILLGESKPFVKTDKLGLGNRYVINLFYPVLHFAIMIWAVGFQTLFTAISAAAFATLHIAALRCDYACRTVKNPKISLNLKLYL